VNGLQHGEILWRGVVKHLAEPQVGGPPLVRCRRMFILY